MAKPDKSQIDKDLELLYKHAKTEKSKCPHCGQMVELGGDFSEMAKAMELRIKYEAIKRSKGGTPVASFFDDNESEGGTDGTART